MRFRKKPVVIEAVMWTGANVVEVANFLGLTSDDIFPAMPIVIHTLEGDHRADIGAWIITGVKGEFYPCKPDIFEQTYEPIEEDE